MKSSERETEGEAVCGEREEETFREVKGTINKENFKDVRLDLLSHFHKVWELAVDLF